MASTNTLPAVNPNRPWVNPNGPIGSNPQHVVTVDPNVKLPQQSVNPQPVIPRPQVTPQEQYPHLPPAQKGLGHVIDRPIGPQASNGQFDRQRAPAEDINVGKMWNTAKQYSNDRNLIGQTPSGQGVHTAQYNGAPIGQKPTETYTLPSGDKVNPNPPTPQELANYQKAQGIVPQNHIQQAGFKEDMTALGQAGKNALKSGTEAMQNSGGFVGNLKGLGNAMHQGLQDMGGPLSLGVGAGLGYLATRNKKPAGM